DSPKGQASDDGVNCRDVYTDPLSTEKLWQRLVFGLPLFIAGFLLGAKSWERFLNHNMRWWDGLLIVGALCCACVGAGVLAFGHLWPPKQVCGEQRQGNIFHGGNTVPRELQSMWLGCLPIRLRGLKIGEEPTFANGESK